MLSKVQKWGNSQGVRLSKALLEDARLSVGDPVDVTVRHGRVIVVPAKPPRKKCDPTSPAGSDEFCTLGQGVSERGKPVPENEARQLRPMISA